MNEKRYEYSIGEKGLLIYDNNGVDDYYFLNDPEEMEKFINLINSTENEWKEKYDVLLNKYKKHLELYTEQDREIRRLKLIIDGLNYALKNIKKIDVEIDLNECGDVE